jgi:hypothetical protein
MPVGIEVERRVDELRVATTLRLQVERRCRWCRHPFSAARAQRLCSDACRREARQYCSERCRSAAWRAAWR